MTLSSEDKKWGRPTYDRVPKILQEDTTKVVQRKRCIYMGHPGHAPYGDSNEYTARVMTVQHPTVTVYSYHQDAILLDSLDHPVTAVPFASGSSYSLSDLDNAEIEVAVFGVGYVADIAEFPSAASIPSSLLPLLLTNDDRNDAAYPDGIESMRQQGLRGWMRFDGDIVQYINGAPTVVGSMIGEDEEGGPMSTLGYQWRDTDFLSLRAVNYKMGLHAYNKTVQAAGFSWQGSPAYNVWQGDRLNYKDGYMDLEGTDILHQLNPENMNVLKYKLNPSLYDPRLPYRIRCRARIYIPDSVLTEVNGGVKENTTYSGWMAAYDVNSRPASTGSSLEIQLPDGTFVEKQRLGYVICGLSVWASL